VTDGPADQHGGELAGLVSALDLIGPRWALLVVGSLLNGPKRYGDLQRELGAPTNMLAARLKELQAAGILYRLPLAHNQRAYALTDRGTALRTAITALSQWGDAGQPPRPVGVPRSANASSPREVSCSELS
jgi:DNA-binding HxlR family transcriptional regulator